MPKMGYHWTPCDGGGNAVGIAVIAAVCVVAVVIGILEWLKQHIWEVVGTGCGVLVLVAVIVYGLVLLVKAQNQRQEAFGEQRRLQRQAEADALAARKSAELPPAGRPAIGGDVHLHFHGTPTAEHIEVAQRVIKGRIEP
jgi:hypothetical protein